MNKIILTIVCILSCIMSAVAQIGYRQDDITYSLNAEDSGNHYAIVIGNILNASKAITIPESISYEDNTYKVTAIGDNAFKGCTYLTDITLPNTLVSIGVSAFDGCTKLSDIILPTSLKTLGNRAFYNCGITALNVPGNIERIAPYAFAGCDNLQEATIAKGVKAIDPHAFRGSNVNNVIIYANLDSIGERAFMECKNLVSVAIEGGTKKIGVYAFHYCTILKDIKLPEDLLTIERGAFYECWRLSTIKLPFSLTYIGKGAFCRTSLKGDILIPPHVTFIGPEAFISLESITRLISPISFNNVTCLYDDDAIFEENGVIYSKDYTHLFYVPATEQENLIIPSTVTTIGTYALYGCGRIKSISLPSSITTIEKNAFAYCRGLTEVYLPNVTFIGDYAFKNTNVNSLYLSEDIDSIGIEAFYNTKLTDYIFPLKLTNIGSKAFPGLKKFACGKNLKYDKIVDTYSPLAIIYDETDIVENGMIFNENRSVIKYMSTSFTGDFTVPEYVSEIGLNAFQFCSNLSSLVLPEGVEEIGEDAFANCTSLKSVHIPASLSSLGADAFYNTAIEKVYYDTSKPITAAKESFTQNSYNDATLYIPKGTIGKFLLVSPWMYFRNIQEIDFSGIDGVESDECSDAPVEYYNLQGMRVENPTSGIYIRRQGSKTSKVFIRQD